MTKETKELTTALRAILAETNPYGHHDQKEFGNDLLALGVHICRQMEEIRTLIGTRTQKCPDGNALNLEPAITARKRGGSKGSQ